MESEYSVVDFRLMGGEIFRLGGGFFMVAVKVVVEVEDSELMVECYEAGLGVFKREVVFFLWHLSLMLLMQANFVSFCFWIKTLWGR